MAATANKRNPQKICFFDWLINEINSRNYEGLYWIDEAHTTFRIPWKHNSRKDLVADDYMIFKAWAVVSRKYNKHQSDPSRWKTNFRCALKSTKRFEELKSNDPDYHEYRIIPLSTAPPAIPPGTNIGSDHGNDDLHISPASEGTRGFDQNTSPFQQEIDVAFTTLSLDNPVPGPNGNTAENIYQCSGDTLQWVMQQANLNLDGHQPVSWAPTPGDHLIGQVSNQQSSAYAIPHVDQNGYHPLRNEAMSEAVENSYYEEPSRSLAEIGTDVNSQSSATLAFQQAQQNTPAPIHLNHLVEDALGQNNCFIENVFMDEEPVGNEVMMCSTASQHSMMEQSTCTLPAVPPVEQPLLNAAPLQNNTGPVSLGLDVSIYYRGRLMWETRVVASSCLFTYNNHHTQLLDNPQIIQFPNPKILPDQKQVQHTLNVLQNTDLLLYQQNKKLCAKRLGRCKVFWAFSKQLDNIAQHPEPKVLQREADVEIFNYEKFCQELHQFHDGQRKSSPDYTIYLCFGQHFSVAKPKESKLILVKLVPVFCKHWHEHVLRDGVSSLNSEIESLQFSNSLFDMMEEYLTNVCMQSEVVH